MLTDVKPPKARLRVLCLEDNPLIVMHLEQMVEDCGHILVASLESFSDLKEQFDGLVIDCALVDIDLADGRTGPDAALWLSDHQIPALFVTGQERLADDFRHLVVGVVTKPIAFDHLQASLDEILNRSPDP